jgi:hypothetical protein
MGIEGGFQPSSSALFSGEADRLIAAFISVTSVIFDLFQWSSDWNTNRGAVISAGP